MNYEMKKLRYFEQHRELQQARTEDASKFEVKKAFCIGLLEGDESEAAVAWLGFRSMRIRVRTYDTIDHFNLLVPPNPFFPPKPKPEVNRRRTP